MKSRIMNDCFSLVFNIFAACLPVFARAPGCSHCEVMMELAHTSYTAWVDTGEVERCPDGLGWDKVQKRTRYMTYECPNCGDITTLITTHTRIFCSH